MTTEVLPSESIQAVIHLELLADLEHQQWMTWAANVQDEVSPSRRARWREYMVPYRELTEEQKEVDREWARKVLAVINNNPGNENV